MIVNRTAARAGFVTGARGSGSICDAPTDALGNLVRFILLPGNRYDTIGVAPLIDGIEFDALLGDKAFDANWIVEEMCKWRHLTETFLRKRKELKRIAMRACKTGQNFEAMIYLTAAVLNSR